MPRTVVGAAVRVKQWATGTTQITSAPSATAVRDRRVVDDTAVHQHAAADLHRREDPWDRTAREDGLHRVARGEQDVVAGQDIGRHDGEGHGRFLQALESQARCQEAAQAAVGHDVAAPSQHPGQTEQRPGGKYLGS